MAVVIGSLAHIAGTVKIDGAPAERNIIVISDNPAGREIIAEGISNSIGEFDIEYADWNGPVIALAIDKYGVGFTPFESLSVDSVVHPTTPNGYVYYVTGSGITGDSEPDWSISEAVTSGSVTFNPHPYYRPIASGPLVGEVITSGFEPGFPTVVGFTNWDDSATVLSKSKVIPTCQSGDIIIAYGLRRVGLLPLSSGWVELPPPPATPTSSAVSQWSYMYYKVANGTEGGTTLMVSNAGGASQRLSLNIAIIRKSQPDASLVVDHISSTENIGYSFYPDGAPILATNINSKSLMVAAASMILWPTSGIQTYSGWSAGKLPLSSVISADAGSVHLRSIGFATQADPEVEVSIPLQLSPGAPGAEDRRTDIWIAIREVSA